MNKKKTSKKRNFSLENIHPSNIDNNKFTEFNPDIHFKNEKNVAEALLQCLIENDTDGYMDILESYLHVNRSQVSRNTNLSRSTVSSAFSKRGNPTLKTVAKIVHESMHSKK